MCDNHFTKGEKYDKMTKEKEEHFIPFSLLKSYLKANSNLVKSHLRVVKKKVIR
jgi:hypothetical protein